MLDVPHWVCWSSMARNATRPCRKVGQLFLAYKRVDEGRAALRQSLDPFHEFRYMYIVHVISYHSFGIIFFESLNFDFFFQC